MSKKKLYMVLDTETATLPFANDITRNAEEKKRIAIARPLVYDIGWTIADRQGNILEEKRYLIAETFSVPAVFDTAYYKDKRPLYLDDIKAGRTTVVPWETAVAELLKDMERVDYACAYNAMFDFKKAIPFTELYMQKLYSSDYYEWEKMQRRLCGQIARQPNRQESRANFDAENFTFRNVELPIIDVWAIACENLINNTRYKKKCLDEKRVTASGEYFSTSAESSYCYLVEDYGFEEEHMALSDARIETALLAKGIKRGKVIVGIVYFPFRALGTTVEFLESGYRGMKPEHIAVVSKAITDRMKQPCKSQAYINKLGNLLSRVQLIGEKLEIEW